MVKEHALPIVIKMIVIHTSILFFSQVIFGFFEGKTKQKSFFEKIYVVERRMDSFYAAYDPRLFFCWHLVISALLWPRQKGNRKGLAIHTSELPSNARFIRFGQILALLPESGQIGRLASHLARSRDTRT